MINSFNPIFATKQHRDSIQAKINLLQSGFVNFMHKKVSNTIHKSL